MDFLDAQLIGNVDNGTVGKRGKGGKYLFDNFWIDLVAADIDERLLASANDQEIVVAEVAKIARIEPAVAEMTCRGFRIAEVAVRRLRSARAHDALFAARQRPIRRIDDFRLGLGQDETDRS